MTRYDSRRLQRFKSSTETSAYSSTCKTPVSLRSSSSTNSFTGQVFLCNQTTKDDVLHQFQTLYMDVRVREVAHEMGDKKLPSLVKEIWLLSKLCTIRIVLKSCTIDTEVTTIGNQVIETTWR